MSAFQRKRLAAGLTIGGLAAKLGCTEGAVRKWERGSGMPHPQFYPKLAKIFCMSAEDVTHLFDPQPEAVAA